MDPVVVLEDRIASINSAFPIPRFEPFCVCCDAPCTKTIEYNPAFGSNEVAEPFGVPVCPACRGHVQRSNAVDSVLAVMGGVGVLPLLGGAINAFTEASYELLQYGALWVFIVVALWFSRRQIQRERARRGHHAGFRVDADEGRCTVHTTSPRVVAQLIALHPNARRQ